MFQNFAVTTDPKNGPPRLAALRQTMRENDVTAYLVPRADAYQGEYVAPSDERLAWLTGFTGSAGFAAITMDTAGVFIDGRYRLQVRDQISLSDFSPVNWPETKLSTWLGSTLPQGGRVGFDPWLHTEKEIAELTATLSTQQITMVPLDNLIDKIWQDRPAPPKGKTIAYPLDMAGESHVSKRQRIAETLRLSGQDHAVITLPDSLAWLLNIRGTDIPRNPVMHGFAIIDAIGKVALFADPDKLVDVIDHFDTDIKCQDIAQFPEALRMLKGTVRVDSSSAPVAVFNAISANIVRGDDPVVLPKAKKNATEIANTTAAHIRDGAVMAEFLCWLDETAPQGHLTEIDVVKKLEGLRSATGKLRDISFETICGSGPHGAIVHYRVTEDTNRVITPGELLLVDSGGQYLDGTTDITRTISTGTVNVEQKKAFTLVLKGMIALSLARWPSGLAGRDLDALARTPLRAAGMDYDHGTGHGVGVYLCVHEGPARISKVSDVPLEAGMILSNEPGYYRTGAFGIRIENLVVVKNAEPVKGGDDRAMLDFETITLAPIDRRLIDMNLLTKAELVWLDAYHAKVAETLMPLVNAKTQKWLIEVTSSLGSR